MGRLSWNSVFEPKPHRHLTKGCNFSKVTKYIFELYLAARMLLVEFLRSAVPLDEALARTELEADHPLSLPYQRRDLA